MDNDDVMAELGFDPAEVEELYRSGVLRKDAKSTPVW
jgi:hypothetical protein